MGALHGNETGGLKAIERAMQEAEAFSGSLRAGTLILIHGNPRATEQGTRFSDGGCDINRLFGYGFVTDLAKAAWCYEHHRAFELQPLLGQLDALVDLHSASRPTQPFAVCDGTPEGIALARKTGCHVTHGWDGPGMLMDHVSIGSLVARGKPALSIECGQHDEAATAENAYRVMKRFLGAVGVTSHEVVTSDAPTYELFARVVKPTGEFQLNGDFSSFDRLEAGSVLGSGEGVTITVDREAFLLLPTPTAVRGEDIVYLARRR